MALTVAELNTRLTADARDLQHGLRTAEKDVKQFAGKAEKDLATFEKRATKSFGGGAKGLGSYLAVDALFSFAMASMNAVDATSELGKEWTATREKIEQGKAAIGSELIPAVASFVEWADKAITKTKQWGDSILSVGGTIENVDKKAVSRGGVGGWLDQLVDFPWDDTAAEVKKVEVATDTLDSTQKFSGETVAELLGIYEQQNDRLHDQAKAVEDAEKAQRALTDAQMAAKDAAFQLEDANIAVADAQRELNELVATGGVDADKVARANEDLAQATESLADANERVTDAQADLNEALTDAAERHLQDVARATEDLSRAQQKLADQTQEVADAEAKLAKLKAQRHARDEAMKNAKAQLAAADTVTKRIIAQDALDSALGMEIVTDQELAAAQSNVTKESGEMVVATDNVATASRDLVAVQAQQPAQFDSVKNAAERLKEAEEAAATAATAAATAQRDLTAAQQPAPGFAREVERTERAVEAAHWAAEKAAWANEKAQRAYNDALNATPRYVSTTVSRHEVVQIDTRLIGPMSVAAQPGAPVVPLQMRPTLVMHDGGMVPGPRGADVPAMLQAGERVIPANQAGAGGGSQQPMVVQLVADGKIIQEILLGHQRRSGALGFN